MLWLLLELKLYYKEMSAKSGFRPRQSFKLSESRLTRLNSSSFKFLGQTPASVASQPSTMSSLFALRARAASRTLSIRSLSSTARVAQGARQPPQPPKPIDDSTSALDYKRSHKVRPPPLPAMDLPRSRSAEEAVTNILYNTPPPSLQPFKK